MTPRLTLPLLPGLDGEIGRPGYDPGALDIGIVHLGIGAFHRAHQAAFTDRAPDIAADGWGIAGVTQRSARVAEQLVPQDGLYTVVTGDGSDRPPARIVGAVREVLVNGATPVAVADRIAAPLTRIVSITVTEKGYAADLGTRRLRADDPDVAADLRATHPHRSVIGQLVNGFAARAAAGQGGLTVLCCDNVVRGGDLVRSLCEQFVQRWTSGAAAETAEWTRGRVRFPDTLVDRIVPATTDADRAAFEARSGYRDEGLVRTEPFGLWVIEDDFAAGHPAWPQQVRLVRDVAPWSAMKLRLLNGAHSLLAYLGQSLGVETVSDAVARPDLEALTEAWLDEATRSLGKTDPSVDVAGYRAALLPRLRNTGVVHRLVQIGADGSVKLPARAFPTAVDLLTSGAVAPLSALLLAAWLHFLERGTVDDPAADRLRVAVDESRTRRMVDNVFGPGGVVPAPDVLQGGFLDDITTVLDALRRDGAEAVVGRTLAGVATAEA